MYLSAERIKGKKAGIPQFPNSLYAKGNTV